MINSQQGTVQRVLFDDDFIQEIEVELGERREKAINYRQMTGDVEEGDLVVVNTTAVDLGLGSGGWHFVMSGPRPSSTSKDLQRHIMKLRYTPLQITTGSCEEQDSPFHELFQDSDSVEGMPVLVGELHSMLPIVATYIKQKKKDIRLVYIQTDHGALPIPFSRHVRQLKGLGWLAGTISVGQAFGGDIEAVNIYSGLVAAKKILQADLAFVSMGPGIVGTATKLGFSGMDQTGILHAATSLKGRPILILRVSEVDQRRRHKGISHHSKTVLEHTLASVHVPILPELSNQCLPNRHHYHVGNKDLVQGLPDILACFPEPIYTMHRGFLEDPLFYYSVALAADFALFLTTQTNGPYVPEDLSHKWIAWTTP